MSNYNELSKIPILVYFSQLIEGWTAKCQPSPQAIEEDYTENCKLSPDATVDLEKLVATSGVRDVIERKFKPGLNFVNRLKERLNEMETKPEIFVAVLEGDAAIPYQDIVNTIFQDLKPTIIYESPRGVHHIFDLTDTDSLKKKIQFIFSKPHTQDPAWSKSPEPPQMQPPKLMKTTDYDQRQKDMSDFVGGFVGGRARAPDFVRGRARAPDFVRGMHDRHTRKMQTLRVLQASGRNPCNCTL